MDKDLQIAQELKSKIILVTKIIDFRIFGSRARGQAQEYSDLDVFLEVPSLNEKVHDAIQHTAWEVGLLYLMHISILVYTCDEIENSPLRASPIIKNIMQEGVVI